MPKVSWSHLPVGMPGSGLSPHLSARMRTETVDALFVGAGGFDRALAWLDESSENYGKFLLGPWARGAMRSSSVELSADDSIESLIDKLDAGEHAKVISPDGDDG